MPDMTRDELARVGLRVKPLEWECYWSGGDEDIPAWRAKNVLGLHIGFSFAGRLHNGKPIERFADAPDQWIAEEKAKGEARYIARILAALTPASVAPDVAGLIKRLERWADGSGIANHFIGDRSAAQDCADAAAALRAMPADPVAEAARAATEEMNTPQRAAFWAWLPLAYRDGHIGSEPKFTKYNMAVAHLAGWEAALAQEKPHD